MYVKLKMTYIISLNHLLREGVETSVIREDFLQNFLDLNCFNRICIKHTNFNNFEKK